MEDERGPGLEFLFVFCVRQSSARGCRFSFVFVYFIIKMCEMFAGSRLLLPVLTNCVTMAKQAPDTDKGQDTVRDQTRFQHVSTQ